MRVLLRATGRMGDYLPAGAVAGRVALSLAAGDTFEQLLAQLSMPVDEQYVVSINNELFPEPMGRALADGDHVIIMAPLFAG